MVAKEDYLEYEKVDNFCFVLLRIEFRLMRQKY